jgi:hypothetical protein
LGPSVATTREKDKRPVTAATVPQMGAGRIEIADHGALGVAVVLVFDCECRYVLWSGPSFEEARSEAASLAHALGWAVRDPRRML